MRNRLISSSRERSIVQRQVGVCMWSAEGGEGMRTTVAGGSRGSVPLAGEVSLADQILRTSRSHPWRSVRRSVCGRRGRFHSLSPPLPSAILSPRRDFFRLGSECRLFLFCPVMTRQRRGFRVRSAASVASTSLPALRNRSVGVQPPLLVKHWGGGGCFQTLGVSRLFHSFQTLKTAVTNFL